MIIIIFHYATKKIKKIIPDIQARDIIYIYFYIFTQVSMTLCVHKLWSAWCSMCKHCEHPWQAKLVVVVFALFLLNHSLIFIYYRAISICDKKKPTVLWVLLVFVYFMYIPAITPNAAVWQIFHCYFLTQTYFLYYNTICLMSFMMLALRYSS